MSSRGVSPQSTSDGTAAVGAVQLHPFYVVVRCRGLSAWERRAGAERFPRRADTDYRAVKCLPAESGSIEPPKRVALVDPDCAFDPAQQQRYDRYYEFDRVFDEHSSNAEVYAAAVAPLVSAVRRGINGTCFAYGMTGAGKTYTMTGDQAKGVQGVCSLAMQDLFGVSSTNAGGSGADDVIQTVHASYLEIYNEKLRDLLLPPSATAPRLDVVEDAERGVTVPNLTEVLVTGEDQLELLVTEGASRRVMAGTSANKASSRSHALLQLTVRRQHIHHTDNHAGHGPRSKSSSSTASAGLRITTGRLMLIDLAGSERAVVRPGYLNPHLDAGGFGASAHQQEVRRLNQLRNEGGNINRSLLALGACLTALGTQTSAAHGPTSSFSHIPYRDSKLTRLLKDSLGGNTRTAMIAAVSPSVMCYEESLSTLKYASRARLITRTVRRNVTVDDGDMAKGYDGLISALTAEVDSLKAQLAAVHSAHCDALPRQRAVAAAAAAAQRSLSPPSVGSHSPIAASLQRSTQRSRSPQGFEVAQLTGSALKPAPRPTASAMNAAKLKLADLKAQYLLLERHVVQMDDIEAAVAHTAQRRDDVNEVSAMSASSSGSSAATSAPPPRRQNAEADKSDAPSRPESPLSSVNRIWATTMTSAAAPPSKPQQAQQQSFLAPRSLDAHAAALFSSTASEDDNVQGARLLVERLRRVQSEGAGRVFGAPRDHNAVADVTFSKGAVSSSSSSSAVHSAMSPLESKDEVLRRLLAARYDAAALPQY